MYTHCIIMYGVLLAGISEKIPLVDFLDSTSSL